MDNTLLLSKVIGMFLVITGVVFAARKDYFTGVIAGFARAGLLRMVYAMLELLAGLFLVVTHNDWSSLPAGIITVIGWMALIEGTALLLMSDALAERFIAVINRPAWYVGGGLLAVVAGLYLAAFGFRMIGG